MMSRDTKKSRERLVRALVEMMWPVIDGLDQKTQTEVIGMLAAKMTFQHDPEGDLSHLVR